MSSSAAAWRWRRPRSRPATGRVDGPRSIADAQSGVLLEEWETAARLTMANPDWQAAMRKRGYTAFDTLFCAPLTVGWFETAEERGRRLLRVPCYETSGARTTVHGRPIEGLFASSISAPAR